MKQPKTGDAKKKVWIDELKYYYEIILLFFNLGLLRFPPHDMYY